MTFGRLTVVEPAENYIENKTGRQRKQWVCVCSCGNTKTVWEYNLKTGKTKSCGCLQKEKSRNACFEDLTGQIFDYLTVISRAEDKVYKNKKHQTQWMCLCKCGNKTIVPAHCLKSGAIKSCGCRKHEGLHFIDLSGQKFGKLTAIQRVENHISAKGSRQTVWLCKCDCGNCTRVQAGNLKTGQVKSCGCLISVGESKIEKHLNEIQQAYKKQYSFPDLVSKRGICLKFDFALFDNNNNLLCLIEYQGEQHYKDFGNFGKYQREISDKLKRDYCKSHNIPLYEIAYFEDVDTSVNNIIRSIHDNTVPSQREVA